MARYQATLTEDFPSPLQQRLAIAFGVLFAATGWWAYSFGDMPLREFAMFVPAVDAILFVCDLVTATLLLAQASVFRSRALMALGAGYLFTALMVVAHALTFPGVFAPSGLLDAAVSTTAWISAFWRAGLPLAVVAYGMLEIKRPLRFGRASVGITAGIAAALVLATALTALSTSGAHLLPRLAVDARTLYYPNLIVVLAALTVLCVAAMTMLARRRKSRLDVYLLLSLTAWIVHLALIAAAAERFTLAWYVAYGVGVASHLVVLLALIADASQTYARLALSASAADRGLVTMDAVARAIAHEARQPLAAISNHALAARNWTNRTPPDAAQIVRLLDGIISCVNQTFGVIESVRSVLTKQSLRSSAFCLNDLVRETVTLLDGDLARRKVSLRLALHEPMLPVAADRLQIQQVIINLLTNAIESLSMTRGRRRKIDVRSMQLGSNEVLLEISDTGVGIASDELTRIFAPFYTTKSGGTGLGLSLSHSIVEEHSGHLWASRGEKHGATFHLQLRCSAQTDDVEESDPHSPATWQSGSRVAARR